MERKKSDSEEHGTKGKQMNKEEENKNEDGKEEGESVSLDPELSCSSTVACPDG